MSNNSLFLAAALAAALAIAGCATTPVSSSGPSAPKGEFALGDTSAPEAKLASDFAATAAARYPKGMAISVAAADLEKHKFNCSKPTGSGGDPPAQVCRRPMKAGGCDHTWQVHLFAAEGGQPNLGRVRALYDRACGADDLLGK